MTKAAAKELYPRLSNHERQHVSVLHRRLSYLRNRLQTGDHSTEAQAYISSEISSLEWALERAVGILPELHMEGNVSLENDFIAQTVRENVSVDFGIQTHVDGRVWVCINGIAWIRFKPAIQ